MSIIIIIIIIIIIELIIIIIITIIIFCYCCLHREGTIYCSEARRSARRAGPCDAGRVDGLSWVRTGRSVLYSLHLRRSVISMVGLGSSRIHCVKNILIESLIDRTV